MRILTEFGKMENYCRSYGRSLSHQTAELFGFSSYHIKDHDEIQETRKNLQQPEEFRPDF